MTSYHFNFLLFFGFILSLTLAVNPGNAFQNNESGTTPHMMFADTKNAEIPYALPVSLQPGIRWRRSTRDEPATSGHQKSGMQTEIKWFRRKRQAAVVDDTKIKRQKQMGKKSTTTTTTTRKMLKRRITIRTVTPITTTSNGTDKKTHSQNTTWSTGIPIEYAQAADINQLAYIAAVGPPKKVYHIPSMRFATPPNDVVYVHYDYEGYTGPPMAKTGGGLFKWK